MSVAVQCPMCGKRGGLHAGTWWISCRSAVGLLQERVVTHLLQTEYR